MRRPPTQLVDGEIPTIRRMLAAVNENQGRRMHGCPPRRRRLCRCEIDYPADDFAVEQVCVGIVDVVETVALGDHLVEQQLPTLVELGQPVDVGLWVA